MFPDISTVFVVALAGFAMSITPGPSMLYVLSRSMGQSQMAGFVSSVGLAVGGIIHVFLAALGIALIIKSYPMAMESIKWTGALYLLYIGITTIFEKNASSSDIKVSKVNQLSSKRIFSQGILVELLNPKTILFFLAFLPQFVDQSSEFAAYHLLILGAVIPLTAIPSDLIVAFTGGALARKIANNGKTQHLIKLVAGGVLIFLAVRLLMHSI